MTRYDRYQEIPDHIVANYTRDYNILYVHDIICKKLQSEQKFEVAKLYQKLDLLQNNLLNSSTILERKDLFKKIQELTKNIEYISSGQKYQDYIKDVESYVKRYSEIKPSIIVVRFGDENSKNDDEDENIRIERLKIIDKYCISAAKYYDLRVTRVYQQVETTCTNCGTSLNNINVIDHYGIICCPNEKCGCEISSYLSYKSGKETSINNCNQEDDTIENFIHIFNQYQGTNIRKKPPQSLYEELDKFFISQGRPSGEEIKKLPLNSRGRRGDTDHQMLFQALSKIAKSSNLSGYYESINLIGHEYWGWELPKYNHLKELILSDYRKTQKILNNIPVNQKGRTSSIPTFYRLYRHLQLRGYECYLDEFKIAENLESRRNADELWKIMCEGANDPDIYYIDN